MYSRYQFEAYSGQGLLNIAQELLEGTLSCDEQVVKHIFSCTTCGACDVNCKSVRDMEVLDTILALRAHCVEKGWGPMPEHRKTAELVRREHNIFGRPHAGRFDWLPGNADTDSTSDVMFFAGCSAAYNYPDTTRDTVKILQAGGIRFNVLYDEEFCCGAPLWRTGQVREAAKLAVHNLEALKQRGVRTLITGCAECYGAFKGFYPRVADVPFQVLHITEVIQQLLREKRLTFNKSMDMTLTYHDPCLLGRLSEPYVPWHGEIKAFGYHEPRKEFRRGTNGVYEAPREILKAVPGVRLVEMVRNAENSFCCGGGGGVPEAFPEFALWTANERLREVSSTGADAIVSCCPFCRANFETAIEAKGTGIKYYDLAGLVAGVL